ncbi:hypothetical protein [Curtobacterium sp. 9128]|uniref:hypothetical protein n=1 Tax=Curtobacterium sp. 9128 TaxID=1793722 RepID=UPI0011A5D7E1|nr:hypothetical protein [Curtobacterium sp. 9128]
MSAAAEPADDPTSVVDEPDAAGEGDAPGEPEVAEPAEPAGALDAVVTSGSAADAAVAPSPMPKADEPATIVIAVPTAAYLRTLDMECVVIVSPKKNVSFCGPEVAAQQ